MSGLADPRFFVSCIVVLFLLLGGLAPNGTAHLIAGPASSNPQGPSQATTSFTTRASTGHALNPRTGEPIELETSPTRVAYTLDPTNDTIGQGLESVPGISAEAIASDPTTGTILAGGASSISVLDPQNGSLLASLPDNPANSTNGADPYGFAFDLTANTVWVADLSYGVTAYNLSTFRLTHAIPLPDGPKAIVFDNRTGTVDSVGFSTGTVTVINGTSGSVERSDPVFGNGSGEDVQSALYDYLANSMYLLWQEVLVLNATSLTVSDRISPPVTGFSPWQAILNPVASTVVVAGPDTGVAFMMNATTNVLLANNDTVWIGGCCGATSLAYNPQRGEIYAASAGRTTSTGVAILSARNDSYVGELNTSPMRSEFLAYGSPYETLFDIGSDFDYRLISGTNDTVTSPVLPLSVHYYGELFDAQQNLLFIATNDGGNGCGDPGTVTVFHAGPHPSFVTRIQVGYGPDQLALDSERSELFVSNFCSSTISAINASSLNLSVQTIPVGQNPIGLVEDLALNETFVACFGNASVWVVDDATLAAKPFANLSGSSEPVAVALDPATDTLYAALYGLSQVAVLNASSGSSRMPSIPVGLAPYALLADAASGLLYVANSESANVTLVGLVSGSSIGSVPVDPVPMAFTSAEGGLVVYVVCQGVGVLQEIFTANETVSPENIPVSAVPYGAVYVPSANQVDVPDESSGAISILANAPQLSTVRLDPGIAEVGIPESVATEVVNGTAPYDATVNSTDGTCDGGLPVLDCIFPTAGSAVIHIRVTDAEDYTAWVNERVNVSPHLSTLTLNASQSELDVGQSLNFVLRWTGGVGSVALNYFGLPPGCPTPATANWTCTPSAAGSYSVTVLANDSDGVYANATAPLRVYPAPEVSSFGAAASMYYAGQRIAFNTAVAGGLAPYNYTYTGLPAVCLPSYVATLDCVPTAGGDYRVSVAVVDSLGGTATGEDTVVVQNDPVLTASIVPIPGTPSLGSTMSIVVSVMGGVPPYNLSYIGLPAACPFQNATVLVCGAPDVGSYVVTVEVTDSVHQGASAAARFSVTPASANSTRASGISPADIVLIGLSAGFGGAAIGVGIGRWQWKRPPPGSSEPKRPTSTILEPRTR